MTPYEAAKIFLSRLLYVNASVAERDRNLYEFGHTVEEFYKSIKILKGANLPPADMIGDLPYGYMMFAAISAARIW